MNVVQPLSPHSPMSAASLAGHGPGAPVTLRWPRVVGVILYLLLAIALGAVVVVTDLRVLPMAALPAMLCALAAYGTEWLARRARNPWSRSAAPALYVAAALLLPAPWVVLIAASASAAWLITVRGGPTLAAIAAAAHTVMVVTIFTLLAHICCGGADVLHRLGLFLTQLVHVPGAALAVLHMEAGAAGLRLPAAPVLIALVPLYYLLDTTPLVLVVALLSQSTPWRVWQRLYGPFLLSEVALLSLGVLGAAVYVTMSLPGGAYPLAVLALPILFGLHRSLMATRAWRVAEEEVRVLRADTADLHARAATAQAGEAATRGLLDAVLSAMRTLGGNDDLVDVTVALARATPGVAPFHACTVYLYEPGDGSFVPHASIGERPPHTVVSRGQVEGLMSERNRLGYSYYVSRGDVSHGDASRGDREGIWAAGDLLLVPLLLKNGDVMGYIELDRPADGRVPSAADLAPLEAVAFLAAGVIARLRHTDEALHLAATDGLTGLLNRRTFEEFLRRALAGAMRRTGPLALLMIDLDDFGSINNTYGHQVGDAALRLVSGVIREELRESDAGARYGGDEFSVILPGLDVEQAAEIGERLRAALVETTARAAADGALPPIHTSIGIASFPDSAGTMDALIKAADDALYHAKRLGKNRLSVAGRQ